MTKKSSTENQMPLLAHLAEMRIRLFRSAIVILILASICFNYTATLMHILTSFFDESFTVGSIIGTKPAEAFVLRIKLALVAAILCGAPYLFFELWGFISPALSAKEKKLMLPFVISTTFFFIGGSLFAYYLVLPLAYTFFASQFELLALNPTIQISEHLDTTLKFILSFAIMFELPIICWVLARVGILHYQFMKDTLRYAIVIIFIISAVLTPPDVISQLLMAGPVLVLYFLSMQIVKFTEKKVEDTDVKTQP